LIFAAFTHVFVLSSRQLFGLATSPPHRKRRSGKYTDWLVSSHSQKRARVLSNSECVDIFIDTTIEKFGSGHPGEKIFDYFYGSPKAGYGLRLSR
jgi:hypothetical protein